jgi:hypothetical protein
MKTSQKTLVILAAIVWIVGGMMLFRSGVELINLAMDLRPEVSWHWLAILLGIGLGIFQALTIFTRSCRKNIQRIRSLKEPKIWQFFRPGFFLALALMISTGIVLDRFSKGHYFFMLVVAVLDFALTISLWGSSYIFWTEGNFINNKK